MKFSCVAVENICDTAGTKVIPTKLELETYIDVIPPSGKKSSMKKWKAITSSGWTCTKVRLLSQQRMIWTPLHQLIKRSRNDCTVSRGLDPVRLHERKPAVIGVAVAQLFTQHSKHSLKRVKVVLIVSSELWRFNWDLARQILTYGGYVTNDILCRKVCINHAKVFFQLISKIKKFPYI